MRDLRLLARTAATVLLLPLAVGYHSSMPFARLTAPSHLPQLPPQCPALLPCSRAAAVRGSGHRARISVRAAADGAAEGKQTALVKYALIVLLVLQNSLTAILARNSRIPPAGGGQLYLGSVAVLVAEVIKLPICLGLIAKDVGGLRAMLQQVWQQIFVRWRSTLQMAVPALCYCLQNALFFVALSRLSATSYQLWSQSKTLFTALFFVFYLGKPLRRQQWIALSLLSAGVGLVQYAEAAMKAGGTAAAAAAAASSVAGSAVAVGVAAVLASSLLSGFANVYFEKVVKTQSDVSIWMRNVQLGLFSLPQAAALVVADWPTIAAQGPLVGFSALVWNVVLLKALGGLLVAAVVKYADNVLKTYATAIAIVLTFAVGCVQTRTMPTIAFLQGLVMVIASIFLYNFSGKAKPGAFGFLQASAADVVQQGAADIVQGAADILQGAADALQEAADALQPTEEGAEEAHNRSRLERMLARLRAIRARGVRNPDKDP